MSFSESLMETLTPFLEESVLERMTNNWKTEGAEWLSVDRSARSIGGGPPAFSGSSSPRRKKPKRLCMLLPKRAGSWARPPPPGTIYASSPSDGGCDQESDSIRRALGPLYASCNVMEPRPRTEGWGWQPCCNFAIWKCLRAER